MTGHFDMIIVGGGPAGSACGILLAEAGLRVAICEKSSFPRDKICGECINPRNWTYFEILGIASDLRSLPLNKIETFRVTNSLGSTLMGEIPTSAQKPFFSIARSVLDSMLLKRADSSGATVLEKTPVREVYWKNGWNVEVETDGSLKTLRSDVLIGADGRNSIVARKMSDFYRRSDRVRSQTSPLVDRVGVQWHTEYQKSIGATVEMFLFNMGYCGVVNLGDGLANVALVTTPELAQLAQTDFSHFLNKTIYSNRSARERLESLNPVNEILTAAPIKPTSHASSHPFAYLVGDARQTVEPFTGEGILFALQDAYSAARSIAEHYGILGLKATPSYSRFVANKLISPALRHPLVAQKLIRPGFSAFGSVLAKSLFT